MLCISSLLDALFCGSLCTVNTWVLSPAEETACASGWLLEFGAVPWVLACCVVLVTVSVRQPSCQDTAAPVPCAVLISA